MDEILGELERHTKLSRKELSEMVSKKQRELSGLVTAEGAAHLVAREFGIDLLNASMRRLELKNVVPGMKNVNAIGKVFKISGIVEFKRSDGSDGKVVNLFIGDATGFVRLPLWNEQTKLVEDEDVKLGDTVQIVNALARENVFGGIELSLGRYGSIRPVEEADMQGLELPGVDDLTRKFFSPVKERICIKDAVSGFFEIKATIVQIFKSNFLFNVCPICGNSLKSSSKCSEHGDVEPEPALVIACVADDGTGNMRTTFFRNLAENVCGTNAKELAALDKEKRYELIAEKLLGKELILRGRIRENKLFNRLEMIVDNFKDLNIFEESEKLISELQLKVKAFK